MPLPRRFDDEIKEHQQPLYKRAWHAFHALTLVKKCVVILVFVLSLSGLIYAVRRAAEQAEMIRGSQLYQQLNLPKDTIPVLMPVYSRPHYLKRSLEALKKAEHIDKTVLIVSQDGNMAEITELINSIDFTNVIHLRHSPPYFGIPSWFLRTDAPTAANVYFLLRFAFEYLHVRAAITVESDLEVSPDILSYFRWAYEQTAKSPQLRENVFNINAYYEKSREGFGDPYTFATHDYGFQVWVWLCPDYSWPLIRDGWTYFGNWDITLEQSVRKPSGRYSLTPTISRARNFGMQGINFDIRDQKEIEKWETLRVMDETIDYAGKKLQIIKHAKELDSGDQTS